MTQVIESLRAISVKWRAGNKGRHDGLVLIFQGCVYGWKNELRDPQCERPGAYAVDKNGLVYQAEGGDEYNGALAWIAVNPDRL